MDTLDIGDSRIGNECRVLLRTSAGCWRTRLWAQKESKCPDLITRTATPGPSFQGPLSTQLLTTVLRPRILTLPAAAPNTPRRTPGHRGLCQEFTTWAEAFHRPGLGARGARSGWEGASPLPAGLRPLLSTCSRFQEWEGPPHAHKTKEQFQELGFTSPSPHAKKYFPTT